MRRTLLSTALSWPRLALTPKTNRCPDRKVEFRVTGVRCYMKADVGTPISEAPEAAIGIRGTVRLKDNFGLVCRSEPLNPRPKLYLPCPGAAWLSKDVEVGLCNRIGIEHRVRLVRRPAPAGFSDPAVDHEMRHVNSRRRQFPRHALRKSTK